jgi:hypothetical protein
MTEYPLVFVHVLARNKEGTLPLYLETMYEWDYPKDRIVLYVRTNNNSDRTGEMLADYIAKYGDEYFAIIYEGRNIDRPINKQQVHEWDGERLTIMRALRTKGFCVATEWNCEYYFTADVDNFVLPHTLRTLVEANQPVIAPLLRYAEDPTEEQALVELKAVEGSANWMYSNFDTVVTHYGDTHHGAGYQDFDQRYFDILERRITGIHQVDLVHATYLVRRDVFTTIGYFNGVAGFEYIIFAFNLRIAGIPQFLDNREIYGCITLAENGEASRRYLDALTSTTA